MVLFVIYTLCGYAQSKICNIPWALALRVCMYTQHGCPEYDDYTHSGCWLYPPTSDHPPHIVQQATVLGKSKNICSPGSSTPAYKRRHDDYTMINQDPVIYLLSLAWILLLWGETLDVWYLLFVTFEMLPLTFVTLGYMSLPLLPLWHFLIV